MTIYELKGRYQQKTMNNRKWSKEFKISLKIMTLLFQTHMINLAENIFQDLLLIIIGKSKPENIVLLFRGSISIIIFHLHFSFKIV